MIIRFAWYSATYMECKQPTEKRFLTDVLLFTHLVHLPRAYASKPDNKKLPWIVYIPCRSEDNTQICVWLLKYYALRLAFRTVRRAFKSIVEDRMSDSSCCRQIRWRIGCRYGVQIYLSENRYILADKDRRSISITLTPKQYNNWNIFNYFCSERSEAYFCFKIT